TPGRARTWPGAGRVSDGGQPRSPWVTAAGRGRGVGPRGEAGGGGGGGGGGRGQVGCPATGGGSSGPGCRGASRGRLGGLWLLPRPGCQGRSSSSSHAGASTWLPPRSLPVGGRRPPGGGGGWRPLGPPPPA